MWNYVQLLYYLVLLACDHVNQFGFSLDVILGFLFEESICIAQS